MKQLTINDMYNGHWHPVDEKYMYLIEGMLMVVRKELDRLYWNANQKEMTSPFDNTGAKDVVLKHNVIRSYNWDENILPNFDSKDIKIFWYKHSGRGMVAYVKNNLNVGEVLADTLNQAIEDLRKYFNEQIESTTHHLTD